MDNDRILTNRIFDVHSIDSIIYKNIEWPYNSKSTVILIRQ